MGIRARVRVHSVRVRVTVRHYFWGRVRPIVSNTVVGTNMVTCPKRRYGDIWATYLVDSWQNRTIGRTPGLGS